MILGRESLVIPEFELSITYINLKRIENMTRDKISAARVVFLGVVGALWKKEQQYMVLTYRDKYAGNNLSLVFKMPHLEDVQPFIYNKMIEGRRKNKNEA